jgi:hypothetical protein
MANFDSQNEDEIVHRVLQTPFEAAATAARNCLAADFGKNPHDRRHPAGDCLFQFPSAMVAEPEGFEPSIRLFNRITV